MTKPRGRRKYNVRGDSWFAVGSHDDEEMDGCDAPSAPSRRAGAGAAAGEGAAAARSPALTRGRDSIKDLEVRGGEVAKGGGEESAGVTGQQQSHGRPAAPSASWAGKPALFAGPSSEEGSPQRPTPQRQSGTRAVSRPAVEADVSASELALTQLLDRFGRWGGLGLDADVVEAVFVELGGNKALAVAALEELAQGLGSPAPLPLVGGVPATFPTQNAAQGDLDGLQSDGSAGLDGVHGNGASPSRNRDNSLADRGKRALEDLSASEVPLPYDGSDLWQSLPPDCQLHILSRVDVRCLGGLAATCRACCAMVRGLRSRVLRLTIPKGYSTSRAAGLVAAHRNATAISFQPCSKSFSGFAAVFTAAAAPQPGVSLHSSQNGGLGEAQGPKTLEFSGQAAGSLSADATLETLTPSSHQQHSTALASDQHTPVRSLTSVNLSGCRNLTDSDVQLLLLLHRQLTHLDLSDCPLLSDYTLAALAEYPFPDGAGGPQGAAADQNWEEGGTGEMGPGGAEGSDGDAAGDGAVVFVGPGSVCDVRKRAGMPWRGALDDWGGLPRGRRGGGREVGRGTLGTLEPLSVVRLPDGSLVLRLVSSPQASPACATGAGAAGNRCSLESLIISGCSGMSDHGLAALLQGRHIRASLQHLDVSRSPHLGPCLRKLPGHAWPALLRLGASSLPSLSSPLQLTNLPQGLRELSLSHCTALPSLTLHVRGLTSLALDACPSLTQASLLLPSLTSLSLSHCKALSDLAVGPTPELTSLRLAHCKALSHSSIVSLLRGAPGLVEVDCSACEELTALALGGGSHRALRSLVLESCRCLREVTVDCPGLELLNVRRGKLLRRVAVPSPALCRLLLSNCPVLQHLDVNFRGIRARLVDARSRGAEAEGARPTPSSAKQSLEFDVNGCNLLPDFVFLAIKDLMAL